ncbi:MAG: RDD family protein [Sulfurimonas sp.]|nr:RDD family protein [Sulfurimonas sp.]
MRFRKLKKHKKTSSIIDKPTYIYAKYSYRVKAFIVDMFMIYAPILYIIAYVAMSGKDEFQSSELAPLIAISIYGLIYALLLSNFGHTPGKKAYDMKVVDARTGNTIGFFRALLRFIAFLFTATTLFGLILPFYRKDKKALHDLICGTIVVVEKKSI